MLPFGGRSSEYCFTIARVNKITPLHNFGKR